MAKTLVSDKIFAPQKIFVGFTSTKYYTLLQAITVCTFKKNLWTKLEKMAKEQVLGLILARLAQI